MTAIGFLILAVMLILAAMDLPETEDGKAAAGAAVIVGLILCFGGIALWIWRVMP